MSSQRPIESLTVDIHRSGNLREEGSLRKGERYIVLAGSYAPPAQPEMPLDHRAFLTHLYHLRYPDGVTPQQAVDALNALAGHAAELLPELPGPEPGRGLQIDLVMSAAELWAFPFEARQTGDAPDFADPERDVILTRRIRRKELAREKPDWPVRPRILFAHAPEAGDLAQSLIDQHVEALEKALEPWSPKNAPQRDGLLEVVRTIGQRDLAKSLRRAREAGKPFTHVHVLAHGKAILDPITGAQQWGLRLGAETQPATDPELLASILEPRDGLPVVVTVAACDSGNQAGTAIPEKSFAQELHHRGVPVVVASQLPLTQPGSVRLTRSFYEILLQGDDVRWALHAARLALRDARNDDAGHDWMSLVGYVQLPEGYADHLLEVGVARDMELLKAARKRLERALEREDPGALAAIEPLVLRRIDSLQESREQISDRRADLRDECQGVLASAHKRLAELRFQQSKRATDEIEAYYFTRASKVSLNRAREIYRATFRGNISHHWTGVQQLSLEAVIFGSIREERDWETTRHAAEMRLARDPAEYWACGTLAELWLLASMLGKPESLEMAKEELDRLRRRAEEAAAAGDPDAAFAVPSTEDQLTRYTEWWTTACGFFGDRGEDLAEDAARLLEHLSKNP